LDFSQNKKEINPLLQTLSHHFRRGSYKDWSGEMPLDYSKSKSAFSHNVRKEVAAGRPQKQAVAIAYSVKRRGKPKAAKKRRPSMKSIFG
jgi:hypothetical protein